MEDPNNKRKVLYPVKKKVWRFLISIFKRNWHAISSNW